MKCQERFSWQYLYFKQVSAGSEVMDKSVKKQKRLQQEEHYSLHQGPHIAFKPREVTLRWNPAGMLR
jgi:hypothetical protein